MKPPNQGKELKLAIRGRGMRIEDAASVLGMSRQTLHNHLVRAELDTELIQNVKKKLGIVLTEIPQPEKIKSNGVVKDTGKYLHYEGDLRIDKNISDMGYLLSLPVHELLAIQKMQDDVEQIKLMQEIISYKQHCESLERENNLLHERIRDKEELLNSYRRKMK